MNDISFSSVENIPGLKRSAAFITDSAAVFREQVDISPVPLDDNTSYIPWGGDNLMPFDIIDLIEKDETLSTCQIFNAEICYGSGLLYNTTEASSFTRDKVSEFFSSNNIPEYFLGYCQDMKHFGFAVSVLILSADGSKIVQILRKQACYCRFAPADNLGQIPYVVYANWRKAVAPDSYERIPLLSSSNPLEHLQSLLADNPSLRKVAIVTRIPTVDSTYYPIPHYASLFRGKWYNIKQLIAVAKEAKLKNAAPIKYQVEINKNYWQRLFQEERITDPVKMQQRVVAEKQNILDFLTGAENTGKAWFSTFYISPDGKECHDVVINKIDSSKEGGDWETDIQEAINMICFAMRVHSNLVGSVPGKSQSNNSGSDKRELYTIAHALQRPYHDLMFVVHNLIINFNGWKGVFPDCPFVQLTTLDKHADAITVSPKAYNV